MKGSIYLIKISNQKFVPALCLDELENEILFAQIRTANDEDIFNNLDAKKKIKYNKGKKEIDQMKIRQKHEINTIYIDQPQGLKSKSVVMVKKTYKLQKRDIVKVIAKVPEETVIKCLELQKQIVKKGDLHQELQTVKKRILQAQMNNERYQHYEKRQDEILREIGFSSTHKKRINEKPFLNYREVPYEGYIKIYRGGR